VIKDLAVNRDSFDRIIAAGGIISVSTGSAPDGNAVPIRKQDAELAMDAAACIGCGNSFRGSTTEAQAKVALELLPFPSWRPG
jgi:succinate dehydrogenase/fumarate reductase-like Fe-S protein